MYEFKGWDYTELGNAWGILNDEMDDQEAEATITNYIRKIRIDGMGSPEDSEENKKLKSLANDIREFLKALSNCKGYETPVWKGMIKIKDDWALAGFTINNLTNMWT